MSGFLRTAAWCFCFTERNVYYLLLQSVLLMYLPTEPTHPSSIIYPIHVCWIWIWSLLMQTQIGTKHLWIKVEYILSNIWSQSGVSEKKRHISYIAAYLEVRNFKQICLSPWSHAMQTVVRTMYGHVVSPTIITLHAWCVWHLLEFQTGGRWEAPTPETWGSVFVDHYDKCSKMIPNVSNTIYFCHQSYRT